MRLSLCIVGCGRYARYVLEQIHHMWRRSWRYTSPAETLKRPRSIARALGGAGFFESYEETVSDPKVASVYFLTPHHFHLENALLAARYSKHILMEKPIACTIEESTKMIRAC